MTVPVVVTLASKAPRCLTNLFTIVVRSYAFPLTVPVVFCTRQFDVRHVVVSPAVVCAELVAAKAPKVQSG